MRKVIKTPAGEYEEVRLWCIFPIKSKGKAWFDDCYINEVIPAGKAIKNLIPNSSFEIASLPGFPDKWSGPTWDYLHPNVLASGLDETNPFEGKYCFRLPVPAERVNHFAAGLGHSWFSIEPRTTYTFSIYMRSKLPNQPVEIKVGGKTLNVSAGTDWKRYTVTYNSEDKNRCKPNIRFRGKDILYLDAAQLEKGNQATVFEKDNYKINENR